MPLSTRLQLTVSMLSLLLIAACGGSVAAAPALKTASPSTSLSVTATTSPAMVGLSQTSMVTAAVTNDQNGAGVTWSIGSAPGSIRASDSLHATYTAPAQLGASTPVTITATSVADTSKSAQTTVTVNPAVSVTSLTCDVSVALGPLQATELTATAINDGNAGMNWSLAAGAPGTLTQEDPYHAAYTAPVSIAAAASVVITASSKADSTKTATITLNLAPTLTLAGAASTPAYWQGLVQYQNGLDRAAAGPQCSIASSSLPALPCKPYALLAEPGTTNPQWQPNILIFHDTQSNSEIWRMSDDPSDTSVPGIVNRTPWNANGSYFILNSTRNPTQSQYGNSGDWLYDARGSLQTEITPFDPNRQPSWTQPLSSGSIYLPPDRVDPNIVYFTTWNDTNQNQWPTDHAFLYALNLAPNAQGKRFQATAVADLPNSVDTITGVKSVDVRKEIRGQLADDDHILINDFNPNAPPAAGDVQGYPQLYLYDGSTIDTVLAANASADPQHLPSQLPLLQAPFSINFGLATFFPCPAGISGLGNSTAPCHNVTEEWHVHDIGISRNAPDVISMNYGPRSSIGELVDFSLPTPFTGPASVFTTYPNGNTPYLSHPGISDDGTKASYDGESVLGNNQWGVWLRNLTTGTPIRSYELWPFSAGHNDWSGYDPTYVVFDGSCTAPAGSGASCPAYQGASTNLYEGLADSATSTFASSGRDDRILAYYPANANPGIYSPTQSPDATKVMVTMADQLDPSSSTRLATYLVVSHRPFPPALAVASTSPVTLTWTPYATHREIAGYHVYRSPAGATPAFTEISGGLVTGTTFTDTTAAAGASYFYAVTAEEYSGLESNQLSNIMQVTAGGAASQSAATGTTGWDTTAPAAPSQLTVTQLTDPSGKSNNVWQVSWTPSTSNNVRYYNVYVSFGSAPQPTAAYRVDSPPLGQTSYIYWQGDANAKPVFGITAMDRQDNESLMACAAAISTSQACVGH